ncbi:hypothetical protein CSKR_111358 [Clonorchis sinensis]|uniref:Uncharacterized protein n=1 Tax=Clonorchis sinensis TaxID=79923 RepID=A0A419PLD7_CLOSI|nr:hypothetical protein CSKR_111358 [Clonorchis sinensis]
MAGCSTRESTDRKDRGSKPASASQLLLSRLGQPGSILAVVLPSGGIAVRHRKGATAERRRRISYPLHPPRRVSNTNVDMEACLHPQALSQTIWKQTDKTNANENSQPPFLSLLPAKRGKVYGYHILEDIMQQKLSNSW